MKTRVSVRLISVVTALLATAILAGPAWAVNYPTYISSTSPVGWWGMNEGAAATTTADLSGAYGAANNQAGVNLDLTYLNPGVNTLPGQAGFVSGGGNSAYLDGGSNSTAYNHSTAPYSGALPGAIYRYESGFSVEVWAKMDGFSGTADSERVIGCREWGLGFVIGGGPLHFTTFGKQDYFSTTAMPLDGGWHQIGVSWDGNVTASFFIDGAAAGTYVGGNSGLTPINNASPNNRVNLGSRATDTQHFKGWIDEAVIWDHTRTETDFLASWVAAHATAAPASFTATPASPLDFGSLGVATASSPQTVTLANVGDLSGDVTAASITGGFVFSTVPGTPTYPVAGGGTAVYGIQLPAQTVPGSYAGVATFTTSTGVFTYDLTATVFAHAGDVNGDGQVSLLDYNVIKANFGNAYESGFHWADGDVNGDKQVGLLDFNIVKAHFGHTTGDGAAVTAVPEPATLSLLALAGLAALRRKR
ncbi:MAG: dockerin type I domain-containing protein [Planctomycetota bacterium]|nr:dockerin type I domain-containing protein [Planctomycetota bacterium]